MMHRFLEFYRYGAYAKKYPDSCGEEWESKKEWGEIGGLRAVFEYRAYIEKAIRRKRGIVNERQNH